MLVHDGRLLMTVSARSYGTADGVAVRCSQYTNGDTGTFDTTTHPTKAQVETFVDQVSGIMNAALATAGFAVPVTSTYADANQAITGIVEEYAADLVLATGMQGRFYAESFQKSGKNRMAVIADEITAWVLSFAPGLGVPQTSTNLYELGYRETDQSGAKVAPLFERKAFGENTIEWDA
jgi:hypothetical protein